MIAICDFKFPKLLKFPFFFGFQIFFNYESEILHYGHFSSNSLEQIQQQSRIL